MSDNFFLVNSGLRLHLDEGTEADEEYEPDSDTTYAHLYLSIIRPILT